MIEITPFLFGFSMESRFAKPRPFSQQRLDHLLARLIDADNGLALRTEQIHFRQFDLAFDYALRASLLGGNGAFVHDAEKFGISVSGGRTGADARTLAETAKRFLWSSELSDKEVGMFSVNTHARADSKDKRDDFLRGFKTDDRIVGPGTLGYVRVTEWPEEVRFSIEPSVGVVDSLFLAWNTQFRGDSGFRSVEDLVKMLESVAEVFGVKFKPLA
jgi:hypothetical protein